MFILLFIDYQVFYNNSIAITILYIHIPTFNNNYIHRLTMITNSIHNGDKLIYKYIINIYNELRNIKKLK